MTLNGKKSQPPVEMEDLINALRQTLHERRALCEKLNAAKADPTNTTTTSRRICYYNDYVANCTRFARILELLAMENASMKSRGEEHRQILQTLHLI